MDEIKACSRFLCEDGGKDEGAGSVGEAGLEVRRRGSSDGDWEAGMRRDLEEDKECIRSTTRLV
jgi:hypothetical protein